MQVISKRWHELNLRDYHLKKFNLCVYFFLMLWHLLIAAQSAWAQTSQDTVQEIPLNQIIEIKLPENSLTVLIGNPEIADILSQGRSSVVISGKRIGQTNLLVKDRDQNVIENIPMSVSVGNTRHITIFHGVERTEFACDKSCDAIKVHSQDKESTDFSNQETAKP